MIVSDLIQSVPEGGRNHEKRICCCSCTEDGQREKYCTVCKAVIETIPIPATGHTLGERVAQEATYTAEGRKETYCTVCGTVVSTSSIPKKACSHEHCTQIGEVDVDCRGLGYMILRCDDCGEEFHKNVSSGSHVWQYVETRYYFHSFHKCWVSHDLYACIYHPDETYLNPDMKIDWDYEDPDVPPPHN